MRDASSGSGHELPTAGSPDSNRQPPQLPTSNLTHELAQLLAASIARQQEARGTGVPTNAGLTSLASLAPPNSPQRTLAPAFRDGLSSLSYSPPRPRPPQVAEPEPDELPDDDEPMPIPSTWRQPTYSDEERWYRQPMGAALLGLGAGLMIVVPTVLWLSGWLEPRKAKPGTITHVAATATVAAVDLRAAEVRTMKVQVLPMEKLPEAAQYVTGSIEPTAALEVPQAPPAVEPPASVLAAKFADQPVAEAREAAEARQAAEVRARLDDLLAQASHRVERGDVAGAREMLAPAEEGSEGPAMFALAETYDPNMLAAWGARGAVADVAKAKALYRKALSLGVVSAQNRLEALQ